MAGNQLGKTLAGAFECAMHLTGIYPDWWEGHRFDHAPRAWAAGKNGRAVREALQVLLLGANEQWGTGSIPYDKLIHDEIKMARGTAGLVDSFKVKHVSGQVASLIFKTYEEGRESWQAATLDFVWFDEEPDEEVFTEGLTRTNATGGIVFITFTPIKGMSNVVRRFYPSTTAMEGTHVTQMTIDDALHYTPAQRALIISRYKDFEVKARTRGIPQLGEGRVFPLDEDEIKVAAFPIPAHWPQLGGMDFGYSHPAACAKIAWDRDNDCVYVTAEYRKVQQTPAMISIAVKPWGEWLPWAWPHDGRQSGGKFDVKDQKQLQAIYKGHGLKMLPLHAQCEDGTNGLESTVLEMHDRMLTGRLKVFSHLTEWFEEFNTYHRKDGLIVKEVDDLMSATRYAIMMRRFAVVQNKPAPKIEYQRTGTSRNSWMG